MTTNVWKVKNKWMSGNSFGREKNSWKQVRTEDAKEKKTIWEAEPQKGSGKGNMNLRSKE